MLPTEDIRSNIGTFAVPTCLLPAVAHFMHDALPNEEYDPHFFGQGLITTYYDTKNYDLRKPRVKGERYLTLRTRSYPAGALPLSAKTEEEKYRAEVAAFDVSCLPAHLQARLLEIAGNAPLRPVVTIYTP